MSIISSSNTSLNNHGADSESSVTDFHANNEKDTRAKVVNEVPSIAVANLRSLRPRINAVIEKMENETIDILLINEVWEPEKNATFLNEIEKTYELKGLKILTCGSRPNGKRGGGAGVVVNCKYLSVEDLQRIHSV